MRILRVFPRRTKATPTDELAFVGEPGLFLPENIDEVHVSVMFTWDIAEGERLKRAWEHHYPGRVQIGGPALGDRGDGFVPGRYLKPGYTITSRGCPNRCKFCLVPQREGVIRELDPIPEGHIVQDNNLLACSDTHIDRVLRMLADQPRAAVFSGGLEAERFTHGRCFDLFRSVRVRELWFAYDRPGTWQGAEKAIRLASYWLQNPRKIRCYVLAGYGDDDPQAAEERCKQVMEAGGLPFMMLWQPPDEFREYGREWPAAQRKWTRPAAMLARAPEQGAMP